MAPEQAMTETGWCEIWRGPDEGGGDYYADSVSLHEGGAIRINCGGLVISLSPKQWHELARQSLVPNIQV
jgi:hypothetical protein